jgi:uncharacterized protein (TIGR03032 family)
MGACRSTSAAFRAAWAFVPARTPGRCTSRRRRRSIASTTCCPQGDRQEDHDALYAPRQSWVTGDLDVHEMAVAQRRARLCCDPVQLPRHTVGGLQLSDPLWRPPFISRLAAEDRCHLNGMALEDGAVRYVTCLARSDVVDGWRDRRPGGGMVLDVTSGEAVAEGLSMPHSPRLRDGKLWLLNSGTGEFGWIDPATGRLESVAFCPGYARGLTFAGGYAIIDEPAAHAGGRAGVDLVDKRHAQEVGAMNLLVAVSKPL